MNVSFDFNYGKIISKPISVHELKFLETFHTYKQIDNIVDFEFAIPHLSEC